MATQNEVFELEQILANGERLGIVGGGNMTQALVFPLVKKGLLNPAQIIVSATTDTTLNPWESLGCAVTKDNKRVTSTSDIVLWGVKPQMLTKAIPEDWNLTNDRYSKVGSLHVSVLAGITLENFKTRLLSRLNVHPNAGYSLRCIRTMPNIGASVDKGCVVFNMEPNSLDEDRQFVKNFFGPTGIYLEVPEAQMNAYSALMGCGVGFMLVEGLCNDAVKVGVPRATSLRFAAQVMKGAGELLLAESRQLGELKDRVCSPGGSTVCGVAALEGNGVLCIIGTYLAVPENSSGQASGEHSARGGADVVHVRDRSAKRKEKLATEEGRKKERLRQKKKKQKKANSSSCSITCTTTFFK